MLSKALMLAAFGAVASAASTAAVYGQCGGQGYTGPTACASGSTCTYNSPYYSQCLPGSPSTVQTLTTSAKASTQATSASTKASTSASSPSAVSGGTVYKASFTEYGAGDDNGSPNCQTSTTACGFFTSGFNVAASQNLFGVGPGAGAGPACGTCYLLTPQTDSSGNALSGASSIVVEVTNLCPADSNPLCAQSGLTGTNQYGANVNFDLCIQSGASAALFGSSGVGLALGTAQQVACTSAVGTKET